MLVISYGITKSGSTLGFEVIKAVLSEAGYPQKRLSMIPERHNKNFIGVLDRDLLYKLLDETDGDRAIVVKTHSGYDRSIFHTLEECIHDGRLKVQTSFRDPREVCLSLLDEGRKTRAQGFGPFGEFETLDQAANSFDNQIKNFRLWGSLSDCLLMPYNEVAFSPEDAIKRIADWLGVSVNLDSVLDLAYNKAYTKKSTAVKNRYQKEMDPTDIENLESRFESFIRNMIIRQNSSWFDTTRNSLRQGG